METFFLGTHQVSWLERLSVPLFVSHHRLKNRKKLPRALAPWALDSGGFSELNLIGEWTIPAKKYADCVRRYSAEIGRLQWAAIQDHMCEPFILNKTGRSVREHQESTVQSLLDLRSIAPDMPWAPVLQGFELSDYLRCVEMYQRAGVDLTKEKIVGVGSICRRQGTGEAVLILAALAKLGIRLHGFGFKTLGLARVHPLLTSADSMAWSFNARKHKPLDGCTHKSCANCPLYALLWLASLDRELQEKQRQLTFWR